MAVAREKKMTLGEQMKQVIEESAKTRYQIAKEAGLDYYVLARFLDEDRDVRLSTLEKLAEYFGMRLTRPRKNL